MIAMIKICIPIRRNAYMGKKQSKVDRHPIAFIRLEERNWKEAAINRTYVHSFESSLTEAKTAIKPNWAILLRD